MYLQLNATAISGLDKKTFLMTHQWHMLDLRIQEDMYICKILLAPHTLHHSGMGYHYTQDNL